MEAADAALLRGWIHHLDWDSLDELIVEGDSAKRRLKALRKRLALKARYYGKPDWEALWLSERFPVPRWQDLALASLAGLNRLPEPLLALSDAVPQWLPDEWVAALPKGLETLGDLMGWLERYYAGDEFPPERLKPFLKPLSDFFVRHEAAIGRPLRRKPAIIKVSHPISDQLTWLPAPALGSPKPMATPLAITADNDIEAAAVWLKAKGGRSQHTFEAYRREATRLLLWLGENQLALAGLKVNHIEQYYAHLADPPPHWLRPRKPKQGQALLPTQVLGGKLSAKSIAQSRTILSQLYGFLQQAGYVPLNPFRLSSRPALVQSNQVSRWLDLDSWHWFWRWLNALPEDTPRDQRKAVRVRWLFALLYHSGMRRDEVAKGRMGDFVRQGQDWSLRVIGKGGKERYLSINSALLQELVRYRKALGLRDHPSPGEALPIVASINILKAQAKLTPRAIGGIIKAVSDAAAADCDDDHTQAKLKQLTTHWLRHTNATHRLQAGASLETTQDELGHADPRTTRIYAKTTDTRRREDAEKLAALFGAMGSPTTA